MKSWRHIFAALVTMAGIDSHATILTVKQDGTGDFMLIQEAINASWDGDTVLVWPGRYYENVNFSGKNITLASRMLTTGDPSYKYNTIIDGYYNGSCVNIMSGETDAVVYGLSLQHGSGEIWAYPTQGVGGGINVAYASCSIQYCDISENKTYGHGGGISIAFSPNTHLIGTSIHHNQSYASGGGILIGNGAVVYFDTINRCNLYENYASRGCDLRVAIDDSLYIYLDTCTVLHPDSYFFSSTQEEGYEVDNIVYSIWNATITPKDADLYVNPLVGNNSNSGMSPDDPFRTIAYAFSSIVVNSANNNTIHLANGLYSDSTNNEKFPLNIRPFINVIGQTRNMTILDGMYKCLIIKGNNETSDYSFRKMTMRRGGRILSNQGFAPAGFALFYAENDNILIDSITFSEGLGYSGFSQLGIEASNNVLVSNCEFFDNIGAHAVRVGAQGDTVRFRNCIFHDNKPDSAQQSAWGGSMVLISFETDVYIENCLFTGNNNYNVQASASFADQGNHYFINCTFSNNTNQSYNRTLSTSDASAYIYNSIFFDEGHPKPIALGWHEAIDTINLEIHHSLIENGESGVYIEPGGPTKFFYDDSNIPGDPIFDTASSYPFSLGDGSPCIDAGTPLWYAGADYPYITQEDTLLLLHINENKVIELSNVDLAGNPRIWNNAIDMGAYEYGPWVKVDELQNTLEEEKQLFVYPNPFISTTQIGYKTVKAGRVEINVYDTYGRYVACLLDSRQPEGKGVFTWTTSNSGTNIIKPGTYLFCLRINGETVETTKVVKR